MDRRALLAAIAALIPVSLARAHPGGLDSRGGHHNRKTGEYHYHRKVSSPAAPPSQPKKSTLFTPGPTKVLAREWRQLPAYQKVEALKLALVRKGVLSNADIEFAVKNLLQ